MKATAADIAVLKSAIEPLDTPERRAQYLAGDFVRSELVKDLDKRYRWDLFWAAWETGVFEVLVLDWSDNHVDTALRHVVPVLAEEVAV